MSTPFKNVAVVGASGSLGVPVAQQLLAHGFNVTALTRASSSARFPDGVSVQKVHDFGSVPSLTAALRGQDAVISAIAHTALGEQTALADAALAAGVRRFVPSEFGLNTRKVGDHPIVGPLAVKIQFLDYLVQKAAENEEFSWTGLSTGSFFDWSLDYGMYGLDPAARKAKIYDSGDARFQVSTLAFIGKALVAILERPEETRNRYLAVAGGHTSQNELLHAAERETTTTGGQKWQTEHVRTSDLRAAGAKAVREGRVGEAFIPLLFAYVFGDDEDHDLKDEDSANKLLGLEEEDLSVPLKAWLAKGLAGSALK